MAVKKSGKSNSAYQQFKNDLSNGTLASVYVFYGEETYLREYYLKQLRETIVPAGFEEFNSHRLSGKGLGIQELQDVVEALPMMCEKTFVAVTDFDLFKLNEEQRTRLIDLLSDFPEYCCLVFIYDTLPYKPDGKMKKLTAALKAHAQVVEFSAQDQNDLVVWVARRCRAMNKDIDRQTAEHLIFTCGSLMTGLVPEIEKICMYAKGPQITVNDINEVADPVIDAVIFDITNAISKGDYDQAADSLGKLLKMQTEPIMILAMIGKELRKLYTACIAVDGGKDRYWLMDLWGMRSEYPAKLLLGEARRFSKEWCREGMQMCQKMDLQMKNQKGFDSEDGLKMLLMQLAQGVKR